VDRDRRKEFLKEQAEREMEEEENIRTELGMKQ
jgi:hypothetical protein